MRSVPVSPTIASHHPSLHPSSPNAPSLRQSNRWLALHISTTHHSRLVHPSPTIQCSPPPLAGSPFSTLFHSHQLSLSLSCRRSTQTSRGSSLHASRLLGDSALPRHSSLKTFVPSHSQSTPQTPTDPAISMFLCFLVESFSPLRQYLSSRQPWCDHLLSIVGATDTSTSFGESHVDAHVPWQEHATLTTCCRF